ncbi:MAG: hypothetical protein LBN38_08325 [Verrucomicrobiota bacterium]|jgi:hypothetical protein|nr:hypothetical protein [Verrucomicrobiota bacterium]
MLENIYLRFRQNKFYITIFFALGIFLRFYVATFGHNFDFGSYVIVGKIASQFGNVYAQTTRYNYGPIWLSICGCFYNLTAMFNQPLVIYRLLIVGLLTLTDLGIAAYLLKRCNVLAALIFFLNPVSIIITGYHNQFDNLAVLLVLLACLFYNPEERFAKNDFFFILSLSFSLITKHLAIFFLFWIFIRNDLPFKKKILYVGIPAILFLLSFVPFLDGHGLAGILNNVFLYKSRNNFPLLHFFLSKLSIDPMFYMPIFLTLICLSGWVFRKIHWQDSILLYLLCFFAFSSAIANQYLAIPLVALVILTRYTKYVYFLLGGSYLFLQHDGLGFFNLVVQKIPYYCVEGITSRLISHAYQIACYIALFTIVKYYLEMNWKKLRLSPNVGQVAPG